MKVGWAASACVLGVVACDKGPTPPTLILDVMGSRMALESFDVSVEPLMADPNLLYRSPFVAKRFTSSLSLDVVEATALQLISTSGAGEVSRIAWQPFVCALDAHFSEKIAAGWRGQETLGAYLQDDGVLTIESDFGRGLPHYCQWSAPAGEGGIGIGTLNRSPTLCSETERKGTQIDITDVTAPERPFAVSPSHCEAYHAKPEIKDPEFSGLISTQILAEDARGWPITLTLSHCWATGETFPVSVTPTSLVSERCGVAMIAIESPDGNSSLRLAADSGTWQLANGPALPGGGHEVGDVDLTFSDPAGGERRFEVRGHVDLPIVKIDVSRLR